jgi:hypothetical protein
LAASTATGSQTTPHWLSGPEGPDRQVLYRKVLELPAMEAQAPASRLAGARPNAVII